MKWALVAFAATLSASVALVLGPSVASGATFNCTGPAPPVVNGNLKAGPGCTLNGTHVTGNVSVGPGGSLTANGATIDGNVEIENTSGTNSICGTTIGKNLQIHNNSGTTTVDDSPCGNRNSVGGEADIHNNSGPVTISHTDVGKDLECHNDSPPASTGTGGNTVGGKSSGECTTSTTVSCPSTGCTTTTSDGNTNVTVNVPGGGKKGNLTVILSAPPQDDGCGPYGEGGQPPSSSGDLVTVNPPGGHGPGNPITVGITYNFSESVFEICKSNNGKPPFTALPSCTFPTESPPPDNAPCAQVFGTGATVYITSTDPAVNGHA